MRRLTRAVTTLAAAAVLVATGTATATAAPARPLSMAAQFGTVAPSASQDTIGDTYPAKWRNIAQDSVVDDWNMYNRECVSWAAFNVAGHGESASNYGDAKYWDDNARQNGYSVTHPGLDRADRQRHVRPRGHCGQCARRHRDRRGLQLGRRRTLPAARRERRRLPLHPLLQLTPHR
jgi:hypothetical protein